MSENIAAHLANSPAQYDRRRFDPDGGMEMEVLPGMDFRMQHTLRCLEWCFGSQLNVPHAVLDVAAGLGNVGQTAIAPEVPLLYHAVEQSPKQCAFIRAHVPGASVAEWRCDPAGPSLLAALEDAEDVFLREYPVVLLSHGPEHHADAYRIMDECWSLVRPGGFLLVVSARNDPHRSHFRRYDWDELTALGAHYAGFGNPLVVWELDAWADLYLAVPKPPPAVDGEGTQ